MTEPVWVRPSLVPARAMPKSVTFTVPDLREQHVAGLHVAVHDAAAVRERERRRDLGGDVGGLAGVERRLGADQVAQRSALDVLHHDEVGARLLAPVVDGDDVGVVQVGGGLRLAPEALDERRFARVLGEERLQRDRADRATGRGRGTPRPCRLARSRARSDIGSKRPGRPGTSWRNPICPFVPDLRAAGSDSRAAALGYVPSNARSTCAATAPRPARR